MNLFLRVILQRIKIKCEKNVKTHQKKKNQNK